jgi:hypothetical protein
MRRSTQFVVAALALAAAPMTSAAAQSATFGVAAGASMATFTGDLADGAENYTSFLGGVFAQMDLGGVMVEPGLYYTGKGAKVDESGVEGTIKLAYLQIPVLLKAGFPMGETSRFYIGAGPAVGFKIGCKVKLEAEGISASFDCDEFEDEETGTELKAKSTEFSGIGVAGVEFGKFAIGLRGDFGLTNTFEAGFDEVSVEPELKTRTISIVFSMKI